MKEYTIQELMEASGVPRRTIYFYCQQGILPPPNGAGQAARYTETHLARLKMIPQLRAEGKRLDDIRDQFAGEGTGGELNNAKDAEIADLSQFALRLVGHAMTQYDLPLGIILSVPARLTNRERARVQKLLDLANDLLEEDLIY